MTGSVQLERFPWFKPDALPGCAELEVGDRIVGVVMCRRTPCQAFTKPSVEIFEVTENGWQNQNGYSPEECEAWTHEPLLANAIKIAAESLAK